MTQLVGCTVMKTEEELKADKRFKRGGVRYIANIARRCCHIDPPYVNLGGLRRGHGGFKLRISRAGETFRCSGRAIRKRQCCMRSRRNNWKLSSPDNRQNVKGCERKYS